MSSERVNEHPVSRDHWSYGTRHEGTRGLSNQGSKACASQLNAAAGLTPMPTQGGNSAQRGVFPGRERNEVGSSHSTETQSYQHEPWLSTHLQQRVLPLCPRKEESLSSTMGHPKQREEVKWGLPKTPSAQCLAPKIAHSMWLSPPSHTGGMLSAQGGNSPQQRGSFRSREREVEEGFSQH